MADADEGRRQALVAVLAAIDAVIAAAVGVAAALAPLLSSLVVIATYVLWALAVPPGTRPDAVIADKAYSSGTIRRQLRS